MKLLVFDIEIYQNLFVAVFYNPQDKKYKNFICWDKGLNQLDDLKQFLKDNQNTYFIGYNSLSYDMNILTEIVNKNLQTSKEIKEFNDHLISLEWSVYREEDLCNKTIDLMLVNNYGPRSAKSTSLKKLEFNMRKKSIKDLPYHFNDLIETNKQVEDVIKYCQFDVEQTLEVFKISKDLIKLRIEFGELIDENLLNSTEPDIAKKYMLKQLSQDLNISIAEVKKLKTYNEKIEISKIILPYIKNYEFVNPLLKSVLDFYNKIVLEASITSNINKNKKLINLKNQISKIVSYYDGNLVYGAGGLHFSTKPGIYESNDEYIILDWDKVSYYPHFAMKHDISPAHLGNSYSKFLLNAFNERKKYNKEMYPIINHSFKIILNSAFGLGNSEYSFLYDAKATIGTTVNGMLTLTMMIDMLESKLSYFYPLQFNTDGITFVLKRSELDLAIKLFDDLTALDNIPYEYIEYKKMIISDVKFAS